MSSKGYKLTRDDGEDLGVFDRRDEAESVAEYEARDRGYELRWLRHFGGAHGKPSTSGRDVFGYKIEEVDIR